jgi:putative flippase GtrA
MKHINFFRNNANSIIIFPFVGLFTALIYFGIFTLFWKTFHFDYKIAVTIAYITSICFHFFSNRSITFKNHDHDLKKHAIKYLVVLVINYLITLCIVHTVVQQLLWSPYIGIIIAVALTVVTGYVLLRFWVFQNS